MKKAQLHAAGRRQGPEAEDDPWLDLAPGGRNLPIESFPTVLMGEVILHVHRNMTRFFLRRHDLGMPEWRVLGQLARYAPASVREFNARSWMDKGQISRALARLEGRGLVERRPDPTHGKRQLLSITPAGMDLYNVVLPEAQLCQALLLEPLNREERQALRSALAKLRAVAVGLPSVETPASASHAEPARRRKRGGA
jgi:DNA-binding MarR family transcriptional regulator